VLYNDMSRYTCCNNGWFCPFVPFVSRLQQNLFERHFGRCWGRCQDMLRSRCRNPHPFFLSVKCVCWQLFSLYLFSLYEDVSGSVLRDMCWEQTAHAAAG